MNYLLTMMMFIDCRCPWPEHGSKSQLEGSKSKRPFLSGFHDIQKKENLGHNNCENSIVLSTPG